MVGRSTKIGLWLLAGVYAGLLAWLISLTQGTNPKHWPWIVVGVMLLLATLLILWGVAHKQEDNIDDDLVEVAGDHAASGIGEVTALDIDGTGVVIKPGTKTRASGVGKITATRIGGRRGNRS
jgi:hypothetical protein